MLFAQPPDPASPSPRGFSGSGGKEADVWSFFSDAKHARTPRAHGRVVQASFILLKGLRARGGGGGGRVLLRLSLNRLLAAN